MQPACLDQQGKPGSKPIPGESSNSTSSDGAGTSRPRVGVGDSGDVSFKMPMFKNPIRKTLKVKAPKILADQSVADSITLVQPEYKKNVDNNIINNKLKKKARPSQRSPAEILATPPPPYREPAWSGIPQDEHYLEVLKGGTICDKIGLNDHAFHLFGRLESNHVQLDHPSLSRYHAVLQYRTIGDNDHDPGFYLYDLDSTHGTTLNKKQIEAKVFCRVRVGHMFKLAGSTRLYILQGGNTSMEGTRNDLSIEQLKDMQQRQMEEKELLRMKEMEEEKKEHVKEDTSNTGISWGMADDADAESDLSHNPFALDADDDKEAPYLKDPKKALRGFFEREDIELEYNVEEMGIGRSHQYICKVVLPLDDPSGKSIVAEAAVSGKKKEAVLACALEACKILDRHGVLRQAKHESKKRKDKNWAADDYYDSDEDTFLDRTGEIEKKRLKRMRKAGAEKQEILTYDKLVVQLEELEKEMKKVEDNLAKMANDKDENKAEDSLDAFMDSIKSGFKDRNQRAKLKLRLVDLRKEHMKLKKLIDIAKPAKMPELKGNEVIAISKSMYNSTNVTVIANCQGSDCQIKLKWVLRFSDCDNAFVENINTSVLLSNPESSMLQFENIIRFQQSIAGNETETCDHKTMFQDQSNLAPIQCITTIDGDIGFCKEEKNKGKNKDIQDSVTEKSRRKRASEGDPKSSSKPPTTAKQPTDANPPATSKPPTTAKQPTPAKQSTPAKQPTSDKPKVPNRVTNTWQDGRYIFVFSIETDCENPSFNITIEFESEHGYLSATQKPLLTFYAVMCAAYTILAFLWLLMMACQWRDILRIQFWICGVVILGLLEKVVFYSEYHHMNKTGFSSPAALIFAELVSCLKRTVARMLVIIVSMGFGITKPRLGPQLHRVIGVGFLFFVLSSIEACLRVQGSVQQDLVASIPLAVLDAVICYWIFTNLVGTTRTLRLRRNLVKLWLYRHFTNCLIFCIVAAIIFLVWSMKEHKAAVCVTRWTELWLDDAYWHILFYIVLVVIIILWRPTANNQRYAYSPLTDALDDDESKEPMIPESFEGMKMRNVNRTDSTPNKVEDDLKWIEDNIPASVADAALAAFDDSDEEIVTNIERSKME